MLWSCPPRRCLGKGPARILGAGGVPWVAGAWYMHARTSRCRAPIPRRPRPPQRYGLAALPGSPVAVPAPRNSHTPMVADGADAVMHLYGDAWHSH